MKKLLVLNIIGAIAINEASASTINPNSGTGAGSAECKNSVVETFDGNTSYSANWQPNTIQLSWYSDGVEIPNIPNESKSCIYDGAMVIPTQPTKTGYTFMGWTVSGHPGSDNSGSGSGNSGSGGSGSGAAAQQCSLSGLDTSISADYDSTHTRWKPINYPNGYTMNDELGEENSSDLNNGEWAVTFSYGVVKGEAFCSTTGDGKEWGQIGNPGTMGGGQYCWCRATHYIPNGENQCTVSSSSWVFGADTVFDDAGRCAAYCAVNCAGSVQDYSAFRQALFGTVSQ